MVDKDFGIDDLLSYINSDKKPASQVSNWKNPKPKNIQKVIENPDVNNIVQQFETKTDINEVEAEGEKKKKKRRRKKNKDDKDDKEDDDEEEDIEVKEREEAKKKNKEMFNTFFNFDKSLLKQTKFQDNSQFRVLKSWKEANNEKGEVYNQTNLPTLQIDEQYKDNNFPEGQIMTYKDQEWRTNNEEKRALERIASYDIQKLRKAAECQRQVRKYAQTIIKPGARLIDICDKIENMNRYLINAQGPECGIAFPTGCSINHCAAHYTPNPGDFKVLGENDVCKIDFGTQVKGLIIDTAFTVAFNPEYDDLLLAVQDATDTGIRESGIDARLGEIGAAIQEVMESYEVSIKGKTYQVKSVKNLCGHSIEPYKIHAGKSVPIVKKQENTKMEEGELFAIETFGSTGK